MKKSSIVILIILLVVIAGLAYWYSTQNIPAPAVTTQTGPSATPAASSTAQNNTATTSNTTTSKNNPPVVVVHYTSSGFSPNPITVFKGQMVTWLNDSSGNIRVASDPHPTHTGYPTTGGCVGSTFDSCASIPPGGSWSFTFTFVGSWGYHNHFNPSQKGTVIVQ